MTRRLSALLLIVAPFVAADERAEALELVSPLASALSNGDADAFLRRIPADVPNRAQLADNIRALLAQAEMTCSIQLRNYSDGTAEFDWYMQIRSRLTQSMMESRRQKVTVRIRNREIASIEPVAFFRPASVR